MPRIPASCLGLYRCSCLTEVPHTTVFSLEYFAFWKMGLPFLIYEDLLICPQYMHPALYCSDCIQSLDSKNGTNRVPQGERGRGGRSAALRADLDTAAGCSALTERGERYPTPPSRSSTAHQGVLTVARHRPGRRRSPRRARPAAAGARGCTRRRSAASPPCSSSCWPRRLETI